MSVNKGKKRARNESETGETDFLPRASGSGSPSSSPLSEMSPAPEPDPGPVKKYKKRADTQAHAALEAERVEAIIRRVGETDVDFEALDSLDFLTETPTRPRLSRASKSLGSAPSSTGVDAAAALLTETSHTITAIKRHRKARHTKLKELVRADADEGSSSSSRVRETWRSRRNEGGEVVCPVCLVTVRGDEDVIEAHVDACLADQTRRLEEARQAAIAEQRRSRRRDQDQDMEIEGMLGPGHVGDVRGLLNVSDLQDNLDFLTKKCNPQAQASQLAIQTRSTSTTKSTSTGMTRPYSAKRNSRKATSSPHSPPSQHIRPSDEDMEVDIGGDDDETLRELVAQGKVIKREKSPQVEQGDNAQRDPVAVDEADKIDLAILAAKDRGDHVSLAGLLQNKIKILESRSAATSLCRICIESYTDPTVSTGCWHTCCKECWLRCLGSTKLCPICKRITAATDLRRKPAYRRGLVYSGSFSQARSANVCHAMSFSDTAEAPSNVQRPSDVICGGDGCVYGRNAGSALLAARDPRPEDAKSDRGGRK
ncbi:RING-type domain-containing protein [Mycena venus]|uniref:RING-type domain-containing protein n=1 Tax=Mycena venus TaxID=2733690 RepID=A0A8H6Y5D4_9AGAR|nr:RING-type domain-containing protein [Mycena venus]